MYAYVDELDVLENAQLAELYVSSENAEDTFAYLRGEVVFESRMLLKEDEDTLLTVEDLRVAQCWEVEVEEEEEEEEFSMTDCINHLTVTLTDLALHT